MVGNKSNKNLGTFHSSEIYRCLVVWGIMRYFSKVLHLIPPMIKKKKKQGAQCQIGLWILEVTDSSFGCVRPSHLPSAQKAASFEWG